MFQMFNPKATLSFFCFFVFGVGVNNVVLPYNHKTCGVNLTLDNKRILLVLTFSLQSALSDCSSLPAYGNCFIGSFE